MTHKEFTEKAVSAVQEYIDNFYRFGSDPQLRINPSTSEITLTDSNALRSAIEDSDEAIENAAAAHGMANQEAMDFQASVNPDFIAVKPLLRTLPDGTTVPDTHAIDSLAARYC